MIIGELSGRTGVSTRSIRYYEKLGLIGSDRSANGYRHYDEQAVEVVRTVRAMFDLGFSREDVRAVLPCATGDHSTVDREQVQETVAGVRDEISRRIEELTRTRGALDRFLADPGSVTSTDPDLLRIRDLRPAGRHG
ncbi:MerR family transcriptional regulator [Cellulomonas fimi]|uniref:MerR family transcriptional regulator n=1 Tax=Cellulomonas sp. RIT-PI-Y TaxID=3035297 RepID=UPI0021D8BACA